MEQTDRSGAEIAERIAALTALLLRLNIEVAARRDAATGRAHMERLRTWLSAEKVDDLLSPQERPVVHSELGELTDEQIFSLNWRLQAAGALVWSVGWLKAMPRYDRSMPAAMVQDYLPMFKPIQPFVRVAERIERPVIEAERERAEFWHWRVRTRLLELQGMVPPAGDSFVAVVERAVAGAVSSGVIAGAREGDIDCDGVPFGKLPQAAWADAASSIIERHYALNWLCGNEAWDEVATHT